jgi:hypothetical protein
MQTEHPNSHKYQLGRALSTHPLIRNSDGTKGTRCFSLLPHRRSWGSGRWMCTCTANSRHNPPTIQRYIPINIQRNDSSSSIDRVWVAAWLEFFFRSTLSFFFDVGDEDGRTACSARNETNGRGALVAGWPRLAGGRTRTVIMPSSDGNGAFASAVPGKGFHFITSTGL